VEGLRSGLGSDLCLIATLKCPKVPRRAAKYVPLPDPEKPHRTPEQRRSRRVVTHSQLRRYVMIYKLLAPKQTLPLSSSITLE
jgi:hypothetical protein